MTRFNNYKFFLQRPWFEHGNIWDYDKNGISAVYVPVKGIAPKEGKQVGGITSY